uniref:Uncharacterized protein n=1 Tax=Romanomermis culicivorax TaxID=13658 RepID=A0A915KTY3_ROMCU
MLALPTAVGTDRSKTTSIKYFSRRGGKAGEMASAGTETAGFLVIKNLIFIMKKCSKRDASFIDKRGMKHTENSHELMELAWWKFLAKKHTVAPMERKK